MTRWEFAGAALGIALLVMLAIGVCHRQHLIGKNALYVPMSKHVVVLSLQDRSFPICYLVRLEDGSTMFVPSTDLIEEKTP